LFQSTEKEFKMAPIKNTEFSKEVIQAFDDLTGPHPGFRPAHAKGILISGEFKPSAGARQLSRAQHLQRPSTPVTVRFSDFAGIPSIPDNHPDASPRGMAIRFHLAEHVHTDIVAHSVDGFPARTAEEFVEFLHAARDSGPAAPKPSPIEKFLGTHPAALAFVQAPKPFPTSFAKESFFAVNAYQFTNESGASRFGRYRIKPEGGGDYLTPEAAAAMPPNYLIDELQARLTKAPVKFRIFVQLAEPGDKADDSTVHWPETREQLEIGTLELSSVASDNEAAQRQIIFDPIPRLEGISSSGDPLLDPRADVYLMSGRRRRAGGGQASGA
jgi:catalase